MKPVFKLHQRAIYLTVVCLSTWITVQADAAVVYLKNNEKPVFGFIHDRTGTQVIMSCLESGILKDRIIPISEIELVINTVDRTRLVELTPAKPSDYRDYAEELAVKRADPEARETSIRLFIITASLDEGNLRTSALRSLIALARSPEEKRRFQALAFRLGVRKNFGNTRIPLETESTQISAEQRTELIRIMRFWRIGSTNRANLLLAKANVEGLFSENDFGLSYQEFAKIIRKADVLGPDLSKLIALEIMLTLPSSETTNDQLPDWGHLISQGHTTPVTQLRLATVSEFDPKDRYFRNGTWTDRSD